MSGFDNLLAPLRPVVIIADRRNEVPLFVYNGFEPPETNSGLPVTDLINIDLEAHQAGRFRVKIWDNERTIDRNLLNNGCRIYIWGAKDYLPNNPVPLMFGFVRTDKTIRSGYNQYQFELTGFGTQIVYNERLIKVAYSAYVHPTDPNKALEHPALALSNIFKLISGIQAVDPLGKLAIEDTQYENMFDYTLVDTNVNTQIPATNFPYVEARQAIDDITERAGAVWGTWPRDWPNVSDYAYLRFPRAFHSGVVILDSTASIPNKDTLLPHRYVSFCRGGFQYEDSIRKEDGFANRIYSKTNIKRIISSASGRDEFSTPLVALDLAQRFQVTSTKLRDLAIKVTLKQKAYKINDIDQPLFDPQNLDFAIVNDVIINNIPRPGGSVIARTSFDVDLEPNQPTIIQLTWPANFRLSNAVVGQHAWLILFQEGIWRDNLQGFDGQWRGDGDNTVNWHYTNPTAPGTNAWRSVINPPGTGNRDPSINNLSTGWHTVDRGTYDHRFTDSFSHVVEASDPDSIDKYGPIETFIDFPFLTDIGQVQLMLTSILQESSRPQRIFKMANCTIPAGVPPTFTLFRPGYLVSIQDTKSGLTPFKHISPEINSVSYTFDSESGHPLGCTTVDLEPTAVYDFRGELIT